MSSPDVVRPLDHCPKKILEAFHSGRGYLSLSPEFIREVAQGRDWISLQRILSAPSIEAIIAHLLSAKTCSGIDNRFATEALLRVVAIPSSQFEDKHDWPVLQREFKGVASTAKTLRDKLAHLDRMALQTKTLQETDFARTGRFIDAAKLLGSLDAMLCELIRECELPPPDRGLLLSRKGKARRASATLKVRVLKREAAKLYRSPMYQVIADLVSVAEDLPPADLLNADDVRKA
ncbi:MAG: hypothetical protein JZU52_16965 [Lamprocystis purpurea]|uniref:hypothetical protein n=1 Tax=Lamprocystis purpurea TaxID=61598 RepID=UPI0012FB933B|nr:hypothetical protein [Lamprocystis purpurea]MBV5275255.1 hypothetical protein [Lamprocystis purpurea]